MSTRSREPMWFCHECEAEMRPLMMPEPHCASCQSTFVEKMENPADDPREFHNAGPDINNAIDPLGFIASFNQLFQETAASHTPPRERSPSPPARRQVHLEFGPPGNRRHFIIGGANALNRPDSERNGRSSSPSEGVAGSSPPRLSDYLRANNEPSGASEPHDLNIPGQLMAQYLMALLSGATLGGPRGSPFFGPTDDHGPGSGRWGDYVFTQDALDQLMTQLMEGANSTRPVPATEEIMEELPREVLEEGSSLLERDCAICKEQFNAKAEDPDEQVVVTLPCKHPFHEGCIIPWLKSSGTCPVCRFAVIPQPNARPSEPGPSSEGRQSPSSPRPNGDPSSANDPAAGSNTPPSNRTTANNVSSNNHTSAGGFFSSLFGGQRRNNGDRHSGSTSPTRNHQGQQHRRGSQGGNGSGNIPGGWGDSLD